MSLTRIETPTKEFADTLKEEQIYMDVIAKICKVNDWALLYVKYL